MGTSTATKHFHPIQEAETQKFLQRILDKHEDLEAAIRHALGAIILEITYGYKVREENDPLVALVETAVNQFALACKPGQYLVDVIPFLKYIPEWVPGAGFKKHAKHMLATLNEMVNRPYEFVKAKKAAGTAPNSLTLMLLGDTELSKEQEQTIKWSVASIYGGGSSTSVAAIHAFFLAMTLNYDVQQKVHAEIDAVCGLDRLPTLADKGNLPYTNAACLEVLRWHSIVPVVVHRVMEDDMHDGYFIPKGSPICANLWKMQHDSRIYPDPFKFDPTRFLGPNPQPDPRELAFGFGRRICPGRLLAEESVFLFCARSMAVFNVTMLVENGVHVAPVHEQIASAISHPAPFKCSIKPRSEKALALIMID